MTLQVVQLRFWMGFANSETADALSITKYRVSEEWKVAQSFLVEQLGNDGVVLDMRKRP
ncbi:MAG: hypothetical protein GF346_03485 [Candidatus Eisenbacteria bacterium]|nr:hypothetical protein [Candidatus Latescibacterota bacterium]MBD3301485.1 hypothetical protein [Candidatus Eisenbacteria bacterium]